MPALLPFRNRNLYHVLGIERTASSDDVKRAYRKRALETHPDKLDPSANDQQKEAAEQLFHAVHEAFEVLGDPIKRHMYDKQLTKRLGASTIVEEAARRDKEREEWAKRRKEESERRIAALRVSIKNQATATKTQKNADMKAEEAPKSDVVPKAATLTDEDKKKKEEAMIEEILKGLYSTDPEFAARREAALKAKAEREKKGLGRRASHQQLVPSSAS
ncbi:DnaJ domain-containing protein [Panaeolus papilionaceus]|nr:DnaJ domain-containing protein [Panaeolus papilionaceus]